MTALFALGDDAYGLEGSVNGSGVPTAITGSMTWRVYGPAGFIASGTCTLFDSPTLTAVYKFIIPTSAPDFARGKVYDVVLQYIVSAAARESIHRFMLT